MIWRLWEGHESGEDGRKGSVQNACSAILLHQPPNEATTPVVANRKPISDHRRTENIRSFVVLGAMRGADVKSTEVFNVFLRAAIFP